jgi:hypothetical protein
MVGGNMFGTVIPGENSCSISKPIRTNFTMSRSTPEPTSNFDRGASDSFRNCATARKVSFETMH